VYLEETSENSSELIKRAVISERICGNPLILHSDNGSPMKAATFKATLEQLGIMPVFCKIKIPTFAEFFPQSWVGNFSSQCS
jgi:putative transposase